MKMVHGVDLKYGKRCRSLVMAVARDSPVVLKLIKIQLHINRQKIRQILHR